MDKFKKLWRAKRVFTNTQMGLKLSASSLTTKIVTFKFASDLSKIFDAPPKGFLEVTGYTKDFQKPTVRWGGDRWIGDSVGVTKVIAKKTNQTIVLTDKYFDVAGLGNYEEALLTLIRNEWIPRSMIRAKPTYKKIDGIFYVNKPFLLEDLVSELRRLPAVLGPTVKSYYVATGTGLPSVTLTLKNPKWTYQFFKNGTVIFTGIKDPSERDEPRKLFKEFFTDKYGLTAILALNLGQPPAIGKPVKKTTTKLANRYKLVASWNTVPPHGFYVRPGTDGKPRLYKWRKMERHPVTREMLNLGPMGLGKKDAVLVAKAYEKAGVPVPKATRTIFENLGFPIETPKAAASVPKNRRAPGWDATRPGFYVRPGPGKQPYWFKVPVGLDSGRKTVIKTYADAGRKIPNAVRNIFKIPHSPGSPKTNLTHVITMGLDGLLRINDRQVTRLTKAELLAVARNMNIPEANTKMTPARIAGLIKKKAGISNAPNRTFDVIANGVFYKLLNDGRVLRTTQNGTQTRRAWSTLPGTEQNKIAKSILPENVYANYGSVARANKFDTLRAFMWMKKKGTSPSTSSNSNNNNNMAVEMEWALRVAQNLGKNYKNGNETNFMKIYRGLPPGANVNSAYANFLKATRKMRAPST